MPPTLKDLAPFITPYTSPLEWAQLHARQMGSISQKTSDTMRTQAMREQTRASAENARLDREETKRWHDGQLAKDKYEQRERQAEKRRAVMSKVTEIAASGDQAQIMAFGPEAKAWGVGLEPEQDAVAPMPNAPPTQLQDPTAPPPPQSMFGMPALAPPQTAELMPPAPPPPSGKRWRVTMDGEHIGTVDFDEIAKATKQQNAGALETYLNHSDPRDRAAMTMGYETSLATPGLNPLQSVELMQKLGQRGAENDIRRRGQDFLQDRTANAASAREAKDRETQTRLQRGADLRAAEYGSRRANEQVEKFKMQDKVIAIGAWNDALAMLNGAEGNSAKIVNVLYGVAKGNDPKGIVTNKDFDVAAGYLGYVDQLEQWFARKGSGEEGEKIKQNLRGLIEQSISLNKASQKKHYAQLRRLRDEHGSDPVVWNAINTQMRTIYGGEGWYRVAEFEDEELQRRTRMGQDVGTLPAAPMATPGSADGRAVPTTQGIPHVAPATSVNTVPPNERAQPSRPPREMPPAPEAQADHEEAEKLIGEALEEAELQ